MIKGRDLMVLYIILTILILYLFAITPKMVSRRDFAQFKGRYYAHRGLFDNKNNAPENSITAFKLAMDNGYGIELDVRLTKDKIPVVFHDATLKRVSNINKNISDLSYDEIKSINLFGSDEGIPLFTDVLKLINGNVPIIIELKPKKNDTNICEIVSSILDNYEGVYCIESFNPKIVYWYKINRPTIIRGQLSTNYYKDGIKSDKFIKFLLQNLLFNFLNKPDFIAFNYKYKNMISFTICSKIFKIPTFAYTIDSRVALIDSKDSFDYFIFEGFRPEKVSE